MKQLYKTFVLDTKFMIHSQIFEKLVLFQAKMGGFGVENGDVWACN
jgi:hypothetical protein